LWYIDSNQDQIDVDTTIYRYVDRVLEPDELGFKYHILTYKEDKSEAEVLKAYIGDVGFFIKNHARAGYNGLMVKNKCIPKKTVKEMFKKILTNWEFSDKMIRGVIKQV